MNSREIIVNILGQIFNEKAYSNIVLNKTLNKLQIEAKDKSFITEVVYGTVKYKYTIDVILDHYIKRGLKSVDPYVLNVLRSSIYQIRYLSKVPDFAVVNEAVELSKKHSSGKTSKFVNGVLRSYLRNKDVEYIKGSVEELLAFKYSFPKWLVKFFMNDFGKEECEKILKGLNQVPGVTVRVNNIKSSYEQVYDELLKLGYTVEEGEICPEALRIIKGKSIENNPLFKEGCITVQDESAMLVGTVMDLEENMTVIDLCSAPGGKTTHIAEIMNNTGKILAFDVHENKLKLIKDNSQRLGINNIEVGVSDASEFHEELVGVAHRVLMDVPCSGLGIIRKKPEIKWNKNKNELKELVKIQRNILKNGSRYLKKGGILLYSTCTLNKEENEGNIKWFLKENPEFKLENIYFGDLDNLIYHQEGYVSILPNKYMDGFFIAKLKKS